jgi:TonB family protein
MLQRIGSGLAVFVLFSGTLISQQVFNPCADGVLLPELVAEVKASCTAAALAAQIEGIVEMNAIVLADGTVGNVTVTKSLDSGLDQAEAIAAWKRSTFRPGRRNGEPVAVRVDLQTRFTLHGD